MGVFKIGYYATEMFTLPNFFALVTDPAFPQVLLSFSSGLLTLFNATWRSQDLPISLEIINF
jgi:hypothetical protein